MSVLTFFAIGIVLFILWTILGKFIGFLIFIAIFLLIVRGACGG